MKSKQKLPHLYIAFVLLALFLGLMFATTSFKNVSKGYEFESSVLVSQTASSIKVGNLKVQNNFFLPARVNLDSLVGCFFSEDGGEGTVILDYGFSKGDYYNYIYDYNFDILGNELVEIPIIMQYYSIPRAVPIDVGKSEDLLSGDLYIFNLGENNQNRYDYSICSSLNKADSDYIVKIEAVN